MNRAIDLVFAAFMLRVLGPEDAGKYYFAIVIYGWFDIITNYGLNTLLTRDVSRDRDHANRYLINTTTLRLMLFAGAVPVLAILLLGRQLIPNVELLSTDTLIAIALLVIGQIPGTIATGLSALFYAYEKAEYPAAVATIATLVKVSLGTIALVLGWSFVGLAGVSIIVNVVTLAVLGGLVMQLFFRPRWEHDAPFQRAALSESFPLMLNNLLATLFFKVDVTLLEPLKGAREVGWYSTGYKYIDAFNVIPSLFTFALFPLMTRQAHDPQQHPALQRTYALAIKLMQAVSLPLAVVTAFIAPTMIGLLGGSEFLPHGAIALAIIVWSIPIGWINSVTNYLMIALGLQKDLTRAFAFSLIFNVVFNLLLIPHYGYAAAAGITIASELFEGALFYFYLRRKLGDISWISLLWRLWLSTLLMLGVVYLLWSIHPLFALAVGCILYLVAVIFLRAFNTEEQATLSSILPARVRKVISKQ
jgi:O-antigen/teichoic acid export membrane protein